MIIKPIGDLVAIKLDPKQSKAHEIQQFFVYERKPQHVGEGTIIAIGPNVKQLKVGDRVHTGNRPPQFNENMQTTNNANVIFLKEDDIFSKLRNVDEKS